MPIKLKNVTTLEINALAGQPSFKLYVRPDGKLTASATIQLFTGSVDEHEKWSPQLTPLRGQDGMICIPDVLAVPGEYAAIAPLVQTAFGAIAQAVKEIAKVEGIAE